MLSKIHMLKITKTVAILSIALFGLFIYTPVVSAQRPGPTPNSIFDTPTAEEPVTDTPKTDTPTIDTPAAEEPASDTPAAEEPSVGGSSGSGEASTGSVDAVCDGVKATGTASCQPSDGETTVSDIVALVINLLSILVGVVAVIMIIVNGFKFVISSGDATAVASARNGIIYAIIGLVIVALSQVIVVFVINKVDNAGAEPKTINAGSVKN
jgi:hypothetical protein